MRHLRWAVGFLISGVALYVALAGVDWQAVGSALTQANYALLLAALPLLLTLLVIRAHRWRLLFYPDTNIRLLSTFGALNIGYMAAAILPLQLGEVARVYVLGEAEDIPKARVLSTVAVERMLDVFALLALLGVLIPFVELPRAAVVTAALFLLGFFVLAVVIVIAILDRARVEGWLEQLSQPLPIRAREPSRRLAGSLLDGLSALSSPRILLYVCFWTVASWLTSAAIIYVVLRAFSLDVPIAAAPFLVVATTFGFFVPSSPGAVGVYHAISIRTLMTVFSVPQDPATSYALVAHALYLIPPTILGACFFWWHRLALRQVLSSSEDQTAAPDRSVRLSAASDIAPNRGPPGEPPAAS